MNVKTFARGGARLLPAALLLTVGLGSVVGADEERRTRAADQDSGPKVRVESSGRGAAAAETRSGGSSSSSSDSGGTSVSSRDSRPSGSSSSGRTRVERRRDSDGWHGGHSGSRHRGYYYYPRYGRYGSPYYYWPWWWGGGPYRTYDRYGYGPYGYGSYGYDGPGNYSRYNRDSGALDIDVSPDRAEVYVDGQYIGTADDFDGFPSYLWLPKGTYDVVIYLPGFTTIARQYSVYPGLVIDVEDDMSEGDAVRPEDLPSTSTINRDERLRRDREREEELESRQQRPRRREAPRSNSESGRLVLDLEPSDASVYLDGRFLGTAADLGRLHSGLIVEAGGHTLEIVRPGFVSERVEIEVEAGEEEEVRIELDEED